MAHFERLHTSSYYQGPQVGTGVPLWVHVSNIEVTSHGRADLPSTFHVGHIATLPQEGDLEKAIENDFLNADIDQLYAHRMM